MISQLHRFDMGFYHQIFLHDFTPIYTEKTSNSIVQLNKSGKVQKCKKAATMESIVTALLYHQLIKAHILLHSGASFGQGPDVPLPRYHRIE